MSTATSVRPQPGTMQERFLATQADVAIAGGAAGCGKTIGLIFEALRHVHRPSFRAVMFRRTSPEITTPGGLWDETKNFYAGEDIGGVPREDEYRWTFPSGAWIRLSHMQHEDDKLKWAGSQIPLVMFDQLETFTEAQWWFMFSRNRSAVAGVAPYIRATCNPVPEDDPVGGWLNSLIAWWLDEEGFPIWDRSGALRYFGRVRDEIVWGDSREEVVRQTDGLSKRDVKSLTFIPGKLEDNPILMRQNPAYVGNLKAMPYVERMRLLGGNWHVRPEAGMIFDKAWFGDPVEAAPAAAKRVRYWDKAGTEGGGRYSAGVKLATLDGRWWVEDVERGQWSSYNRNTIIRQTAAIDGRRVEIVIEQEPGSGGKESAEISIRDLAGFVVHADRVTGDKVTRAKPFSAQVEAGNVRLVRGPWNKAFLDEHHRFTGKASDFSDQVDAASGGFNHLTLKSSFEPLVGAHSKSTANQHQGESYRDPRFGERSIGVEVGGERQKTVVRYRPS